MTVESGGTAVSHDTIALHEETVEISKRRRDTQDVVVSIKTVTTDHQVDETLTDYTFEVDRVAIGHFVDDMPTRRQEGDTLVIPVVEERLVRRLFLKENIRITRVATTRQHVEVIPVRREEISISRRPAGTQTQEIEEKQDGQ